MRTRLIMTPEGAIYKESYNSVRVDLDLHDYFKRQAKAELHFVTPSLGAFGDPADPIVADLRFVMRPEGAPWQTAAIRIPRLNPHTVWEAQDNLLLPTFAQNGVLIDPKLRAPCAATSGVHGTLVAHRRAPPLAARLRRDHDVRHPGLPG